MSRMLAAHDHSAGDGRHPIQMADSDGRCRKTADTFPHRDLVLAATALLHGLTVVTRDRSDSTKPEWQCSIRGNSKPSGQATSVSRSRLRLQPKGTSALSGLRAPNVTL